MLICEISNIKTPYKEWGFRINGIVPNQTMTLFGEIAK
jgi:hypothetical protein